MHINSNLIELRTAEKRENRSNAILSVSVLLLCALIIFTRFFWLFCVEVDGDSMLNTLNTGDLLLVSKLVEPECGDVVVFRLDGKDYIKRVIATGGDTIKFIAGEVYVKKAGENQFYKVKYQEKGKTEPKAKPCANNIEYVVASDSYYVLGDNRENSLDSRYFGSVKRENMLGVVPQWSIDNRYTFWSRFYPYL